MTKINLSISATSFNNKWPQIKIYHNNDLIDQTVCQQLTHLEYIVNSNESNTLIIELYNKSFGDDGIWDVDSSGEGLGLTITDISLDDVSIGHLLFDTEFETFWTDNQLSYETEEFKNKFSKFKSAGALSLNGKISFNYTMPVYEFLIDKKYKVPHDKNIAFYSNSTELFHYEDGLAIADEIEQLIYSHV